MGGRPATSAPGLTAGPRSRDSSVHGAAPASAAEAMIDLTGGSRPVRALERASVPVFARARACEGAPACANGRLGASSPRFWSEDAFPPRRRDGLLPLHGARGAPAWAHPAHSCAGTGLTPPTSAPRLGSPAHSCTRTELAAAPPAAAPGRTRLGCERVMGRTGVLRGGRCCTLFGIRSRTGVRRRSHCGHAPRRLAAQPAAR